jgi:hypothetical protein
MAEYQLIAGGIYENEKRIAVIVPASDHFLVAANAELVAIRMIALLNASKHLEMNDAVSLLRYENKTINKIHHLRKISDFVCRLMEDGHEVETAQISILRNAIDAFEDQRPLQD